MYNIILIDLDNTVLDFDATEKDSFKKIIEAIELNYKDVRMYLYKFTM